LLIGFRLIWSIQSIIVLLWMNINPIYQWLGTLGYALSCSVPFLLYCRKNTPRYAPALTDLLLTGGLFLILSLAGEFNDVMTFLQVPSLTFGYFSQGRHGIWAALALSVYPFLLTGSIPDMPLESLLDGMLNLLLLFVIGYCFQKLVSALLQIRSMYRTIQEQNQTLENYAKQIEKMTLLEERNRLSRELHDTVGHSFTTAITGMDAVYYLIDASPQEAKSSLRELLQFTRNGLDEVRKQIHQIAPDKEEQSLTAALEHMGNEFSIHSGTKVMLEVVGAEYPVSEQIRTALIRCMQESLTNAKKHGQASIVEVRLEYEEQFVRMQVADNGTGINGDLAKGFGLQAMTDRLDNLNGSLRIEPGLITGTVVACQIPIILHPSK